MESEGSISLDLGMITSAAVITACAQSAAWAHANALLELQTLQDHGNDNRVSRDLEGFNSKGEWFELETSK